MQASPIAKELVLLGGGHSHVQVLRSLGMNPIPGLQITLVSPSVKTPYSGMLPGVIAGHYREEEIHIDLVPLCRFAGARFIRSRVTGLDPYMQSITCEGRPDLSYDVVSIDIGITPSVDDIPGASGNVIPVKPIDQLLNRWDAFFERVLSTEVLNVAFVGAGAAGVELCLAAHYRLRKELAITGRSVLPNYHLFHDGPTLLKDYPRAVQKICQDTLASRNIQIWPEFRVNNIKRNTQNSKTLYSTRMEEVSVNEIFWATAASSQSWLADTGLQLDEAGFIEVEDTLQSTSHSNVFAVGDIAHVTKYPRPKAGVYAVRQGPPLTENLRRLLLGGRTRSFKPQSKFLSLISTGDKSAIAHRNGFRVKGEWVWKWKNWIDQRFMKRFSELPLMKSEAPTGLLKAFDQQMQCGGCGSKVGAELLNGVLDELGVAQQDGGIRDDAAVCEVSPGELMLHTVDSFRSFVDDPYLFAQISVTHALSDIYAMGGRPVSALAVVTVPFAKPDITRNLLRQLISGAVRQLKEDGVELVGGHTSEGMELSLGFAVNGVVEKKALLTKSGMQTGDSLILTKPLGTGTLLAADMQHQAKGEWIDQMLNIMKQSNHQALDTISGYDATGCTDVTGFGLAGHLMEMINASERGVILDLDALPVMEGAVQVISQLGIRSTLHDSNRAIVTSMPNIAHASFELLFDPQTSGGLLVSMPSDHARTCIAALKDAGYDHARVIGSVTSENQEISFTGGPC